MKPFDETKFNQLYQLFSSQVIDNREKIKFILDPVLFPPQPTSYPSSAMPKLSIEEFDRLAYTSEPAVSESTLTRDSSEKNPDSRSISLSPSVSSSGTSTPESGSQVSKHKKPQQKKKSPPKQVKQNQPKIEATKSAPLQKKPKAPTLSLPAKLYPLHIHSPMFIYFSRQYFPLLTCYHLIGDYIEYGEEESDANANLLDTLHIAKALTIYLIEIVEQLLVFYQKFDQHQFSNKINRETRIGLAKNMEFIEEKNVREGKVKHLISIDALMKTLSRIQNILEALPEFIDDETESEHDLIETVLFLEKSNETMLKLAQNHAKQHPVVVPTNFPPKFKIPDTDKTVYLDTNNIESIRQLLSRQIITLNLVGDILHCFIKEYGNQKDELPQQEIRLLDCARMIIKLKIIATWEPKEQTKIKEDDKSFGLRMLPPITDIFYCLTMIRALFTNLKMISESNRALHLRSCNRQNAHNIITKEFTQASDNIQLLQRELRQICHIDDKKLLLDISSPSLQL